MATKTKKKMRTRTVAILAGIGVAVAGGGLAFAYFTNVGAGTGTAGTGSNNPIVVKQTGPLTAMGPGIAAQQLSGNFDNLDNTGPVFIKSVTATVTSVTIGTPQTPAAGCGPANFVIGVGTDAGTTASATTASTPNAEIPVGSAQGAWSGLTIQFKNSTTVNQDACKNTTANITYVANAQ
jgi:hypothetical protein